MNTLNNNVDDVVECPLCMEPLEVDDLNFFPCTCGYQICRFCWHRIRTDENELCPACRKEYPENPADFKPLTQEEIIAFKSQKRQRDQQRKQKITENRKHLANVRVVQKNLVFVVGLPPRLADADILKKHEYFGKYGKIHKVVINPSTAYAGVQGPSASAYVTYVHNADALRAIQSVNNIMIDGRLIKTSLGTTKYCSHFMKNQQCPKGDCMYLHDLGDPEASFTKEEMHQGKHQEYEKRLHDVLIASTGTNSGVCVVPVGAANSVNSNNKISENIKVNSTISNSTSSTSISTSSISMPNNTSTSTASVPQKEAWPSLSVSPVNPKEFLNNTGNKSKKDRSKQEKNKIEKNPKSKLNKNNGSNSFSKDVEISTAVINPSLESSPTNNNYGNEQGSKSKIDKSKERNIGKKEAVTSDIDVNEFEDTPKVSNSMVHNLNNSKTRNESNISEINSLQSASASSINSACVINECENNSVIENESGKSTPGSFNENLIDEVTNYKRNFKNSIQPTLKLETKGSKSEEMVLLENSTKFDEYKDDLFAENGVVNVENMAERNDNINRSKSENKTIYNNSSENNNNLVEREKETADTITESMSHLKFFDENSFFSSTTGTESAQLKQIEDDVHNQLSAGNAPNLPDLINGIDGYQNTTNEWEEALKSVVLKTNKQMEEKLQQNLHQQHLQTQCSSKQQEELKRIQEFQKHNNIISSLNLSQLNGIQNDIQNISNSYLPGSELSRQSSFLQQQLLPHQSNLTFGENTLNNSVFGTNMSKFFDFHKHQQQKLQQHCLQMNGPTNLNSGIMSENFNVMPLLDNNRLNSQLVDQNCAMSSQQHHKQRVFGKIDQMLCQQTLQTNQQIGSAQSQPNQYMHSSTGDDDLGFDPFIETQKALAELIENEEEQSIGMTGSSKILPHSKGSNSQHPQQQHIMDYMQRARMPPPGFNHVNNFSNYGVVPRLQNSSKIMPFMNLSNNYTAPSNQHIQHQQQLQIPSNAWNTNLGNFQQHIPEQQIRQVNSSQINSGNNQKGYSGNDWTAMDPAILSFRQFSFPPQTQIAPQLQPQQQEIFLQQLAQQQQQAGFNTQSQHLGGGNSGLSNTMLNSQPSSQPHVNANVQGMLEYLKTRQFV